MDRLLRLVRPPAGDQPEAPDDDEHLVAGLQAREDWATAALLERHGHHVRRVLIRILGTQGEEHQDAFQDVLTGVWQGIGRLHDPRALKSWLTRIAVYTARNTLRSRRRRHWLSFFDEVPEVEATWAGPELREAARAIYEILDRIPVDERIPLALRLLDHQEVDATAAACGVSPATVRRRLIKAQRRFSKLAREYDVLRPWMESR